MLNSLKTLLIPLQALYRGACAMRRGAARACHVLIARYERGCRHEAFGPAPTAIWILGDAMHQAHDLIVFSHLRWNFVWQRPQHLLTRMADSRRVCFIEEPV